jgi:enterochelin esterase family protein
VRFWEAAADEGSPLVEHDDDEAVVTVVYRDAAADQVSVVGGLAGADPDDTALRRVPGTDVWHRSYSLPRSTRTLYWFSLGDPDDPDSWRPDELNPRRFEFELAAGLTFPFSVLELDEAPPLRWSKPRAGVPVGTLETARFRSETLGNERPLWTYRSEGLQKDSPLLVLLDGRLYAEVMPTTTILDNLIGERILPPLAAVMADSLDQAIRSAEMGCNPAFADALADELVPWARVRLGVDPPPEQTIVGGLSFTGLASAFAALRRPDVFGSVLSQSGAFQWKPPEDGEPEWLLRHLEDFRGSQLRFHLAVGTLETWDVRIVNERTSLLDANRHLRDALSAAGHEVVYREFAGGHDFPCWEEALPDGLRTLVAGSRD